MPPLQMPLVELQVFFFFMLLFCIHVRAAPQQTSAAVQAFMDQQVSINKVVDVE